MLDRTFECCPRASRRGRGHIAHVKVAVDAMAVENTNNFPQNWGVQEGEEILHRTGGAKRARKR